MIRVVRKHQDVIPNGESIPEYGLRPKSTLLGVTRDAHEAIAAVDHDSNWEAQVVSSFGCVLGASPIYINLSKQAARLGLYVSVYLSRHLSRFPPACP